MRFSGVMLSGIVALSHGTCCASAARDATELNIGIFTPFSDSRVRQENCPPDRWNNSTQSCINTDDLKAMMGAGLLAVSHFNNRDSSVVAELGNLEGCNKKIRPFTLDTGMIGRYAAQELLGLMETTHLDGIVGAYRSAVSTPLATITGLYDLAQISYASSADKLNDRAEYPTFARTIPSNEAVAFSICKFWQGNGYKHAGMIYLADAVGADMKEAILMHCAAVDVEVVPFAFLPTGGEQEVERQVKEMAKLGLNVFLATCSNPALAKALFESAYDNGILRQGKTWAFTAIYNSDLESVEREEVRQALVGSIRIVQSGGSESVPEWSKFTEAYLNGNATFYNEYALPWAQFPTDFATNPLYDPEGSRIRHLGVFQYDAVIAFGLVACSLYPTEPIPNSFGLDFVKHRESHPFRGATGYVKFDSVGNRDPATGNYELNNFVLSESGTFTLDLVKIFDSANGVFNSVPGKEMLYNGGSKTVPTNIDIPTEEKQYDASIVMVCRLFAGFNITLAVFFLVWTLANKKHQIIRAAQTPFLACIAIGAVLSSSSVFPITVDDTLDTGELSRKGEYASANQACMAAVWLYATGFVVTFGPLFTKMYRAYRVFYNPSMKRVKMSNRSLFLVCSLLLAVDYGIILAWQQSDPLKYFRTTLQQDQFGNPTLSVGKCDSESAETFVTILICWHVFVLLIGNYIAYLGRNIVSAFNESKYTAISLLSQLQVLILAVPVLVMVADNPKSNMFLRSGVVLLSDLTCQCLIFVPKIKMVYFGVDGNESGLGSSLIKKTSVNPQPNTQAFTLAPNEHQKGENTQA